MRYHYLSSPSALEYVFSQIDLELSFTRRIKNIILIVNDYAEIYDLSKTYEKTLVVESILYSYDRVGKLSPIENLENIQKEIDQVHHDIELEHYKNKRWCGIARWLSCRGPF